MVLQGIEAFSCEVEIDVSRSGLAEVRLVGLPDAAVKESISRVQSAMRNSGYHWPGPKVTINLAPADMKKEGPCYDLPIAIGAMVASGELEATGLVQLEKCMIIGELALDGRLRPVKGALAAAMLAKAMKMTSMIVPSANAAEAAVVGELEVYGCDTLAQAIGLINGQLPMEATCIDAENLFNDSNIYEADFVDVRGQEAAKRALTIAVAGHHNILMLGPPGSGKTMLAKRIVSVMPPLTAAESLQTTRIYSARGLLKPGQSLLTSRPVRMPHHSTSSAALIGGGAIPQPGEVSLAHHGVLFLDEFPEFPRGTLEMIRQPLEDRYVTIPRVHSTLRFPASVMLVAAMNPCPCGYATDPKRKCNCSAQAVQRYMNKLSGPLIDRIDIHIEVPAVGYREIRSEAASADSLSMRQQVTNARNVQLKRFGRSDVTNATMNTKQLRNFCHLGSTAETLLAQAMNELGLSARAHDKVLRVARTIADLESRADITSADIAEAIQYRRLDRSF